jgi:hypothetical protein
MSLKKASYHETFYYLTKNAGKGKADFASNPFSKPKMLVENRRTKCAAPLQLLKKLLGG